MANDSPVSGVLPAESEIVQVIPASNGDTVCSHENVTAGMPASAVCEAVALAGGTNGAIDAAALVVSDTTAVNTSVEATGSKLWLTGLNSVITAV